MSNEIRFNPKQAEFIRHIKRGTLRRINLLEGAVRSGKTWVSLIGWGLWIATRPTDVPYLMAARTLTTLERNVLEPMQQMFGAGAFRYSISANNKRGTLFGRKVLFEGADNALAEMKVRGSTLGGVYIDEATLVDHGLFQRSLASMSVSGAKMFATTNPDTPRHWLKMDYIDRVDELDMLHMQFGYHDNPILETDSPEYHANLMKEYTGVFYRRFILGEWCVAEGAIYPNFDPARHVVNNLPAMRIHTVAVDYGHSNPTVYLLLGIGDDGRLYIIDEDVHKAADEGDQSPRDYSAAMVRFLRKHERGLSLDAIVVDPSARGFINQLKADGVARVKSADNEVLPGIQLVSSLISADMLRVHARCAVTIGEMQGYTWDRKAQARGEDKPLKVNDHAMDALRYGAMRDKGYWKGRIANDTAVGSGAVAMEAASHQLGLVRGRPGDARG